MRRRDESKNIMSQALPYRPDIDTLRAAAVLSVIVFHIEKNWLPGGFLGVDIFFVISGFLMTAILLREMSGGGEVFPEGILYPPHQTDFARIFRRIGGNAGRRLLFIHQR
nr:acyltransferase [Neisseria meningitidis]